MGFRGVVHCIFIVLRIQSHACSHHHGALAYLGCDVGFRLLFEMICLVR